MAARGDSWTSSSVCTSECGISGLEELCASESSSGTWLDDGGDGAASGELYCGLLVLVAGASDVEGRVAGAIAGAADRRVGVATGVAATLLRDAGAVGAA